MSSRMSDDELAGLVDAAVDEAVGVLGPRPVVADAVTYARRLHEVAAPILRDKLLTYWAAHAPHAAVRERLIDDVRAEGCMNPPPWVRVP